MEPPVLSLPSMVLEIEVVALLLLLRCRLIGDCKVYGGMVVLVRVERCHNTCKYKLDGYFHHTNGERRKKGEEREKRFPSLSPESRAGMTRACVMLINSWCVSIASIHGGGKISSTQCTLLPGVVRLSVLFSTALKIYTTLTRFMPVPTVCFLYADHVPYHQWGVTM
jgi:hypothetical protein